MKIKKSKTPMMSLLILVVCHLTAVPIYAQEDMDQKKAWQIESQLLANPKEGDPLSLLNDLSNFYFSQKKYNEFADFLKKFKRTVLTPCEIPVGYYIALCRSKQLKDLEDNQNWQEYFDSGVNYRQEIFSQTEELVSECSLSSFTIKGMLINWLTHKAQNDDEAQDVLNSLMVKITSYADLKYSETNVFKELADTLLKEGEPLKAKSIYNIYANKLLISENNAEKLKSYAKNALSEGNIDLSEIIYNRFIEMISTSYKEEKLSEELAQIAKDFLAYGWAKGNDPIFAESIFNKLKELCGFSYFNEDLQYLRAYNLQAMKDYKRCKEEYEILIKEFPNSIYLDEAEFKLGIICTYILARSQEGKEFFENVSERNSSLEYALISLYHMSLLNQYAKDLDAANSGYAKIIELTAGSIEDFKDLILKVNERQKEIKESKPIEYNLMMFLDSALANGIFKETSLELTVNPQKVSYTDQAKFSVGAGVFETGCLSPQLTYLWSGDLGSVKQVPQEAEFPTDYKTKGTKVVNLAIMDLAGNVTTALAMVDAYPNRPANQ